MNQNTGKPTTNDPVTADIIGRKLVWLLQSHAVSQGVIIEEFGESFYIDLVAYLDDGQYVQIGFYNLQPYAGDFVSLKTAELSQEDYTLADIEGKRIIKLHLNFLGLYIIFENDLALANESHPGGNFPLILHKDEIEDLPRA